MADTANDRHRRRRLIDEDERASEAVVEAVATATGADPDDLPALDDRLDTDCLDGLLVSDAESTAAGLIFTRTMDLPADLEISFTYAGWDVTVTENYVVLD